MLEESRTERLERLIGREGVDRLFDAVVMIIGIGGVGSNCVEALARAGVGHLILVDPDCVQASNINRQAIAFERTIGKRKVDVMEEMIAEINPDAHVEKIAQRILPDDIYELLDGRNLGMCIDAQDTVVTKLALAAYCEEKSLPFISSMGAANTFDPTKLEFADIYDTHACPLCRVVRKQARKDGISHMRVLYSTETPAKTQMQVGASRSDRSDLGTMSYMPAIMGQMLAARTICDLLGIEWE